MSRLGLSQSCEGAPGVNTSLPSGHGDEGEPRSSYYNVWIGKKIKTTEGRFLRTFLWDQSNNYLQF